VIVVVDHHHRRGVTGAEALEVDEGAAAVGSDLVLGHVQLPVQSLHDLSGAAELARQVGTHADAVPADRLLMIEVVEGDDAVDLRFRKIQLGGDRGDCLVGQPAVPEALGDVEGRQESRLGGRVALADLVQLRLGGRREARRVAGDHGIAGDLGLGDAHTSIPRGLLGPRRGPRSRPPFSHT